MARHKKPQDYQVPIYKTPFTTEYDKPQSISDIVGADNFVGSGSYIIGERNHVPCVSRSKESGAAEDNSGAALSAFFGNK